MSVSRLLLFALSLLLLTAAGCQSPQTWFESMKGEGFPESSNSLGGTVRGGNPNAKPSGSSPTAAASKSSKASAAASNCRFAKNACICRAAIRH